MEDADSDVGRLRDIIELFGVWPPDLDEPLADRLNELDPDGLAPDARDRLVAALRKTVEPPWVSWRP